MDLSKEGLIGIEDKGKEPEVLGYAVAFGQIFLDVSEEQGYQVPVTTQEIIKFCLEAVSSTSTYDDITVPALKKFRDVEVDVKPRDLVEEEFKALFAGLSFMEISGKQPFRGRLRAGNLAGQNGRVMLLDLCREAPRYRDEFRAFFNSKEKQNR